MSKYAINPRNKTKPYMTVALNKRNPDMIEVRSPDKGGITFDIRASADLVMAINEICRQSGYAYIPNLGSGNE